jgi:hypothetical protein
MTRVFDPFSFRDLTAYVLERAPKKDLIEVVSYGWEGKAEKPFPDDELLREFADDRNLAFICRNTGDARKQAILIRASCMREAAAEIESLTWRSMIDNLSRWAAERGYSSRSI